MQKMDVLVPSVSSDYSITGTDCQVVSVNVKPGESVYAEPGAMLYKSVGMKAGVQCGSIQRVCVGETLCKGVHTNTSDTNQFIGLTPAFPAKVVPVDLSQIGGKLITKGGAYMANSGDVRVSVDCDCNIFTCCCGGLGFCRQSNIGTGTVFLAAGGTVLTKQLGEGEAMIVDTNCVVGFQESVTVSIKRAGGCCTMCCGGEGLFNTKLKGPGLVIVQSMSFEAYRNALAPAPPRQKKNARGGALQAAAAGL